MEDHRRVWRHIASPGTWFDGAQRVAIAAEARNAKHCPLCQRRKEALSPYAVEGDHASLGQLPEPLVEVVHRIATDPGRLTHSWYKGVIADGVTEGEYVEAVGIVAHITAVDTFIRAIGADVPALPEPLDGAPTRYRPAEAKQNDAWVPNIVWDEHGPNEADYFQEGIGSNIRRALTLVPDEARSFFTLSDHQYLTKQQMWDFVGRHRAVDRSQIELLAGRVSAINQCTY